MMSSSPSRLLDHLPVDHLDVRPHAVLILPEGVLGHAALVLRRELVADGLLHLVQRGAVSRRLLHGGDEVGEVAAEEGQMALREQHAMAGDDAGEVELLEGGQGLHPVSGKKGYGGRCTHFASGWTVLCASGSSRDPRSTSCGRSFTGGSSPVR